MPPKPKKTTGTALVNWEKELAEDSALQSKAAAPSGEGSFISVRAGVMSYKGEEIPGNAIRCVVVDFVYENAFYTGRFDPENPQPPACYAFSRDDETLAPHDEAEEPQADNCAECPNNEWGSADTGPGKACKNIVRLALIPEDALDDPEALANVEVAKMKIPVTSKKNWDKWFQRECNGADGLRPSFFYVVEVSCEPDPKRQVRVTFETVERLKDRPNGAAEYTALRAKLKGMGDSIMAPYPKAEEVEQRRAANKKPAAKKNTSKFAKVKR